MHTGLKIWRYRGGVLRYRTSSDNRQSQDLALDDAELTKEEHDALREDDWIIQMVRPSRVNDPVTRIRRKEIAAVIPAAKIPADGDVWHFDGAELHRVYRRSASPDADDRRAEVASAINGGSEHPQIVFYRGDSRPMVYHLDTREWEYVDIERVEGEVDVAEAAPDAWGGLIEDDERLLITVAKRFAAAERKLRDLVKAREAGDDESAAKLLASVTHEVIMGAEPAPVQGHNVLHGLPGMIDKIEQLDALIRRKQSLEAVSDSNRATATGDFGTGVGLVDGAWQSVGSLTAFVTDSWKAVKIAKLSRDERSAKHGANARSRALLTVATHGAKASATTAAAIEAIGKVATFSTAVPTTLTPITGAITGVVATVRSSIQADKSRRRMGRLQRLLKQSGAEIAEDVQALLAYGMRKAGRKFKFKTGEASVAALGTVGSTILIVGAVVAGANAWNPVGWGIGIAVTIAGAGLLTYKIWRKVTSAKRARKRGFSRDEFPTMLVEKFLHYMKIDPHSIDTQVLLETLAAYGVRALELLVNVAAIPLAVKRIKRHLA
jgi:hypothetical protein